jgi:hypothetical protein
MPLISSTLPEFENQFVFYQNVNSVTTIEPDVLVLDRLWMLELESDSAALEFMSQTLFIGSFQEAWPQFTVNFGGTTDHAIGEIVEFHLSCFSW